MKKVRLWIVLLLVLGAFSLYLNLHFFGEMQQRNIAMDALDCRIKDGSYWCDFGLNTVVPQVTHNPPSFSMYPSILDADFLMCTPFTTQDKLTANVVYTYKTSTENIAHRCVSVVDSGTACVFKGDNNIFSDGVIPRSDVLAKCNWVVRYVG